MNQVKLRLEIEKLRDSGECGPKCQTYRLGPDPIADKHCAFSYCDIAGHIYTTISKCAVSAMVFRSRTGLDAMYAKDKILLENLQYSTEKLCRTCANIMCFKTHAKGLTGPCKYWKPQILLDYPELSPKIKLEGVTKRPKKVGEVGYSFGGLLSNVKRMELSISVGTFSRGMTGGSYVYRMHSKDIKTRGFFYTLKEFGYERD